jgi:hypothetical protein
LKRHDATPATPPATRQLRAAGDDERAGRRLLAAAAVRLDPFA